MNNITDHYDSVSLAWQTIMGEHQHYGLYKNGSETIDQASQNLIEEMLRSEHLDTNSKVLDVGCGTGGPAFFLHKQYGANITGIALGATEIAEANSQKKKIGITNAINFFQADGQDNQLYTSSFDYVVMMESALLVPDKKKLFSENHRVLKDHGAFILCDQTKIKNLSPAQMYRYGDKLEALQATFGLTKTETLEAYVELMGNAGFKDIESFDISHDVIKSPAAWKQSCMNNRETVLKHLSLKKYHQFLSACDTLEEFLENKVLSYGIVKGIKTGD